MGEDLHKERIRKYYQERLEKIYCSIRKNILSEIAYPFKNLLLGRKFIFRLYVYSSSDLTNVNKVNLVLPWATFQEAPAVKIDFKCTGKG